MEFIEFKKNMIGDGHLELKVEVSGKDVSRLMEEAYRTLAEASGIDSNEEIGKLHNRLLAGGRRTEDELAQIVKGYTLSRLAPYAVDSLEEETITEPMFFCEIPPRFGEDLKMTVIVTLKPELKLSSLLPVRVAIPELDIQDEEIDAQLLEFAVRNSDFVPSDLDRPLQMGDFARIDSRITKGGEEIPNLSGEDNLFEVSYKSMPEEFIDAIIGLEVGQTREFDFKVIDEEGFHASIKLRRLMERYVPDITDEWLKEKYPLFETVDEFRESLRVQLEKTLESKRDEMKGIAVDYALLDRVQGSIPDEVYEFVMDNMTENFKSNLKKMGISQEEFFKQQNTTEEEYVTNMMLETRRVLRQSLALDALFKGLQMKLEQEDIDRVLAHMAPGQEKELYEEMVTSGRRYVVLEEARRDKAHRWLVDTATYDVVTDESRAAAAVS